MKKILVLLVVGIVVTLSACSQKEEDNSLVVGIECAYAPFDWTTSSPNEFTVQLDGSNLYCDGYDVDIAKHIANELGKDLVVKKIEWTGLIPALQSGVIDMIVSAMSPTEERKESVLFSDAYYRVDTVMVVDGNGLYKDATSISDFSDAKVIAQQDTIQDDLIDQIDGVTHMLPLSTASELVVSLTSGTSDAIVTEYPVAKSIVASNPSLVIVQFLENDGFVVDDSLVSVSIAVRLGETDLISKVNTALALIDNDTRLQMMEEATKRQPVED